MNMIACKERTISPVLSLIFLIVFLTGVVLAQNTTDFFIHVDEQVVLNDPNNSSRFRQREILQSIKNRSYIKIVRVVRIDQASKLLRQQTVSLNAASDKRYEAIFRDVNIRSSQDFTWIGELPDKRLGSVLLAINKENVTGTFHTLEVVYFVEPLGDGLHAIIQVDPEKLPGCIVEEEKNLDIKKDGPQKSLNSLESSTTPADLPKLLANPQIDILVAYTTAVANASNENAVINGAIDATTLTFTNSSVPAIVNKVHQVQVSYNEGPGSFSTHLSQLRDNDGNDALDVVHSLRDQYGADIVVLLVDENDGNVGGIAYLNANGSTAFAVVEWDLAIGNYSFAHEIGHNVGCDHNPEDRSNPFYPYGHGYIYTPANWRTVMAVGGPTIRIPYWSNPDKTYGGVLMGTTQTHDNVRVWENRASTVAGFKSAFSVVITGPNTIQPGVQGTWTANASGGSGTITYQWSVKYEGSSNYVNLGTNQNQSLTFFEECTINELKVVANRGGLNGQDLHSVYVTGQGGTFCKQAAVTDTEELTQLPETFALHQNYPNPFNPTTEIKFDLPEPGQVTFTIFNIVGQKVRSLLNGPKAAGYHSVLWDGKDEFGNEVASGVYVYRIRVLPNGADSRLFESAKKMTIMR